MHRCSLSHSHFICEGASHSNLIPVFLYQRKGRREKKKKTTSRLILGEYICSVYICVCARVCVCLWVSWSATPSLILKAEDFSLFFFHFFPLDLFSNVDVYHLSNPQFISPLLLPLSFLSIIRKGVNLLKCELVFFFNILYFTFGFTPLPPLLPSSPPSLHLCLPICLFVPVAVQVRGGGAVQSGCDGGNLEPCGRI